MLSVLSGGLIASLLPAAVRAASSENATASPDFNRFDFVPLIIEAVFLVAFSVAMGVVEYLIRAGVLAKEEARGPTKIHLEHLKVEYKDQETKFLEAGGQANPVRTPRSAVKAPSLSGGADEQPAGPQAIGVAA
ncbi:hypothetical protein M3Y99_00818600 [Aphelenchoides fujianensis]|nr:hypothetical protein M3Y99_01359400 [Aphelenchoides fujianensis]KAI6234227.1 hypothetical protein M3Y99_00818600 [Aphelenchoides fujianensis]